MPRAPDPRRRAHPARGTRRTAARLAARSLGAALILLALAPVGILHHHPVAAADRGLVLVMQTRYDALPDDRLVRVTIDAVATSHTPDSAEGQAYYSGFTFSIPAGATALAASSGGQGLSARLGAVQEDFREAEVTFSRLVFYQQSYPFRVVFDLPDVGDAPDRDLRVGSNIVAFPVLAYGSPGEPGSGVTVVLPTGFRASVQGSAMVTTSGASGEVVLSAADLDEPFDFYAYLAADRPGTFGEHHLQTIVAGRPAPLWIRSWEDDPDWGRRMSNLMSEGIPVLQELIGLPYSIGGTLVVEEAAPTRLGDYAGTYDELTGKILVRYDADALIGLHEAAHIWFNSNLFGLRWIDEGWAEFYAVQAAEAIGEEGSPFNLTDELLELRIALNDWDAPGIQDADTELFAYAASYHVADLIFGRADLDGLRAVWRAVANGEMSYQPARARAEPDLGVDNGLEDWQQLLDLLDERVGTAFDDIWIEWIVSDGQGSLMDERAGARDRYAVLLAQAGDWDLPGDLRSAMSSWEFEEADADIALAGGVLTARDRIVADAEDLGLTPPGALQSAFEGDGGLAAAQEEAAMELEVLVGIAVAMDRLDEAPTLLEAIGLLGADPAATLDAARTAFEAARLGAAAKATAEAVALRAGAESAGQLRTAAGAGGAVVLGGGTLLGLRLRRRRRAATPSAPPMEPLP